MTAATAADYALHPDPNVRAAAYAVHGARVQAEVSALNHARHVADAERALVAAIHAATSTTTP